MKINNLCAETRHARLAAKRALYLHQIAIKNLIKPTLNIYYNEDKTEN